MSQGAKCKVLWVSSGERSRADELVESISDITIIKVRTIAEALECLRVSAIDAVLAEVHAGDSCAAELLEEVQKSSPGVPVLFWMLQPDVTTAVLLARMGARDVFGADLTAEQLQTALLDSIEDQRSRERAVSNPDIAAEPWKRLLVGESREMHDIGRIIRLVGPRRCTVLITGETGTGKEMVARALHMASPRSHVPMVAVNCGALPETLLEAELFGHVKGAFTGATSHRVGRFEQAHGGTLFLDEIGEMPLSLQTKLLRVLQEREFQRVGSSETIRVDGRVIAATNANLLQKVKEGTFRGDLYYRLNVVPIRLPALKDRPSDIPQLAYHLMEKVCRLEDLPSKRISPEAMDQLCSYYWPGNVRQLENVMEMAIVLSGERNMLTGADFALPSSTPRVLSIVPDSVSVPDGGLDFELTVSRIERSLLEQALRKCRGNKTLAAEMLRLKRTTLTAKLRNLESETAAVPDWRPDCVLSA
jgi:DNA-binding NtrC family response regulator